MSSDSTARDESFRQDALLAVGVDARHLFEDHKPFRRERTTAGLARALGIRSALATLVSWKTGGRLFVASARHRDLAAWKAGGVCPLTGET